MAQMRLIFKKIVPELWTSDSSFPLYRDLQAAFLFLKQGSYKGHGSSAVGKVGISLLEKGRSV